MTKPDDPAYLWEFRAEDFVHARLDEDKAAAEARPEGDEREAELDRILTLRLIAGEHSIYVDGDGRNHARCYTCEPAYGLPCSTMCRLTRLWRHHPDYVADWNRSLDNPRYQTPGTDRSVRTALLGGFRKEHEAAEAAFAERFTRVEHPGDQWAWQCKACGAAGEPWTRGRTRSAATGQHPQCPPDPTGPWAWTIRPAVTA
jgi:hypothetical protein